MAYDNSGVAPNDASALLTSPLQPRSATLKGIQRRRVSPKPLPQNTQAEVSSEPADGEDEELQERRKLTVLHAHISDISQSAAVACSTAQRATSYLESRCTINFFHQEALHSKTEANHHGRNPDVILRHEERRQRLRLGGDRYIDARVIGTTGVIRWQQTHCAPDVELIHERFRVLVNVRGRRPLRERCDVISKYSRATAGSLDLHAYVHPSSCDRGPEQGPGRG